jgi:hypothetical protein
MALVITCSASDVNPRMQLQGGQHVLKAHVPLALLAGHLRLVLLDLDLDL